MNSDSAAGRSVIVRATRRYSYSSWSTTPIPSLPSTKARLNSQATPPTYAETRTCHQRRRSASGTAHQAASTATSTAGIVPGPNAGIPLGVQRREVTHVHVPTGHGRQRHRQSGEAHGNEQP